MRYFTDSPFERLMMETKVLTKDVGSVLGGEKTVDYGLIDAVGGISDAMQKLHEMIEESRAEDA